MQSHDVENSELDRTALGLYAYVCMDDCDANHVSKSYLSRHHKIHDSLVFHQEHSRVEYDAICDIVGDFYDNMRVKSFF